MCNIQTEKVTAINEKRKNDFEKEQEGQMTRLGERKGKREIM